MPTSWLIAMAITAVFVLAGLLIYGLCRMAALGDAAEDALREVGQRKATD